MKKESEGDHIREGRRSVRNGGMYRSLVEILRRKNGSQMVEASIVLPLVILVAMLLIRVMVFYMEILCAGVRLHGNTIAEQTDRLDITIKRNVREDRVDLAPGGVLRHSPGKDLKAEWYLINFDQQVRARVLAEDPGEEK